MPDDNDAATRKLEQVRGVTWQWRDEAPEEAKDHPGMGVIAQEVEKVFPELVVTDDQGRKKVNYAGLIGPLIEAVKELDQRLQAAEQRIAELERKR